MPDTEQAARPGPLSIVATATAGGPDADAFTVRLAAATGLQTSASPSTAGPPPGQEEQEWAAPGSPSQRRLSL
jgi:hypothetical protein